MIEGVIVEKLKKIEDNRGSLMHMLRCDSPHFTVFGEIYFSYINCGAVKAWKKHMKMTQNFAVPAGNIKLVIYDDRENSSTKGKVYEIEIGEDNYCLVTIPPMLWYGFKGISNSPSLIANCADIPHDPAEIMRIDFSDPKIPYKWNH
jgi:dTDP-4-dehydrorhamnose 3,5-epimerase